MTKENPSTLTRQDWRYPGTHGAFGWAPDALGYWLIDVTTAGTYNLNLRFLPDDVEGKLEVIVNGTSTETSIATGVEKIELKNVELPAGKVKLEAQLTFAGKTRGVHQIDLSGT